MTWYPLVTTIFTQKYVFIGLNTLHNDLTLQGEEICENFSDLPKLSLCFRISNVIITWFFYCWWLPPTWNPHLICCLLTPPGGYFMIFCARDKSEKGDPNCDWDHTRQYTSAIHLPIFLVSNGEWFMGYGSLSKKYWKMN